MSDWPPSPSEQRAADAAEARATRRRWITLAEFVAVAGLLVAAASLWLSWSDRRADIADKAAEKTTETHARGVVTLTGEIDKDGGTIRLADPAHQIDSVTVAFPAKLGIAPQSSVLGPRISADWFADALRKAKGDAASGRLPVLLTATWWDGETKRTNAAIYDVAWQRVGSFPFGHKIVMRRLSLRERAGSQAALDAAWAG